MSNKLIQLKAIHPTPPYASKNKMIDGVIIVDRDIDFDDNPLFYVNSEYPTYKELDERGYFIFDYEFYTDKAGNRYMVISQLKGLSYLQQMEVLVRANWNMARNVDSFVKCADKKDFEIWLDLIS